MYSVTHNADNNREAIEFRHIGTNRWSYSFPDGNTLTVTITSTTTASVTEEGITSGGYRYTASYTVTKDDHDNPTAYDLSAFQGTWTVSQGGGTATGNGRTFDLTPNVVGSVAVRNVQSRDDTVTGDLSGIIYWNVYQNSAYIGRVGLEYTTLIIQRLSGNTWRTSDGKVTMTLTSQSTASIIEEGTVDIDGYTYQYHLSYNMTKQ